MSDDDLVVGLIFAFVAVLNVVYVCWTLWSGKVRISGGLIPWTFTREDNPIIYWSLTSVYVVVTMIVVLGTIWFLQKVRQLGVNAALCDQALEVITTLPACWALDP
jgi:hypothetical protein